MSFKIFELDFRLRLAIRFDLANIFSNFNSSLLITWQEQTKAYTNLESGAVTHYIWQTSYLLLLASAFLHVSWHA